MHLAPLIRDLAVILGLAAIVTFVFRLIRQPVVLGYVLAGIIVGPYTPSIISVVDTESVKVWAELGVIFLMFSLGLEFSFRRLIKVGFSAGVTAVIQITAMMSLGFLVSQALGWQAMDAIFIGCMVAISSTTIIIKALDELGLKTQRFAELVFGILVVEDLVAILMMVALSNIAAKSSVSGIDLLAAGFKLAVVVGAWLVIGMFVVPRFVKAVASRGSNEMMTVMALGLCLALVSLSAYFEYSVALGAFIMGSILAETKEVHHIEELVAPLRDVFGAVFFVSVGMMLDPSVVPEHWLSILCFCTLVVLGQICSVSFGALATGQPLSTAIQAGFSLAQIGEFSFIIASLGIGFKAIDPKLYPIMVAVSLLTTFTTPYLIAYAPRATAMVERRLPPRLLATLDRYGVWFQRNFDGRGLGRDFYVKLIRWLANAIVVITIFVIAAEKLIPLVLPYAATALIAQCAAWGIAFLVAAPFIWAMVTTFKGEGGGVDLPARTASPARQGLPHRVLRLKGLPQSGAMLLVSRFATSLILGLLSLDFFAVWIGVVITTAVATVVLLAFRKQIGVYYRWFERKFMAGIEQAADPKGKAKQSHAHLVPWDAHLAEIGMEASSAMVGKTLADLQLRERFGISVVVVKRLDDIVVAPKPDERLFPGDVLLCYGTDDELVRLQEAVAVPKNPSGRPLDLLAYGLRPIEVPRSSPLVGCSIRDSKIRESFDCMVVGLERQSERIKNPKSDLVLKASDLLWVVGESQRLADLTKQINEATV